MHPTHKLLSPTSEAPFGSLQKLPTIIKPVLSYYPGEFDPMYASHLKEYNDHIALLKTYPLTSELKGVKVGDLVTEGVEFNIKNRAVFQDGNYGQVCKSCNDTFYKAHKYWFLCEKCCKTPVAIPLEKEKIDTPVKGEFFLPPDHGDECWTEGAETFTRKEVFSLLWTQRAMITNDLKQFAGKDLTEDIYAVINHPRTPKF